MSNIQIETDLKEILNKFDQKLDKLDNKIDILQQNVDNKINHLQQDITDLKIGQSEIKGEIKALDTKVEQLDKRVSNSEFTNRGVVIGLIVVILGGIAKLFGFMGNN